MDSQFYYYMPPYGGIKPVCHDRHKTVPEFIVILCNQMWMTTTEGVRRITENHSFTENHLENHIYKGIIPS